TASLAMVVGRRGGTAVARLGIVSEAGEAWRSVRGGRIDRLLRLDLTLNAASEGGPAVDASGRLIGMAVFGPRGRVLVIPGETIARVVPQILAGGSIGRGYLGLGLHPVPAAEGSQGGVIVISIDPKGPGAKAGLIMGDLLVAWNGESIRRMRDILLRLGPDSVETDATLGLVRAGVDTTVLLHVGRRNQT
ncbi:MAG: S1C family serine protease, partial [Pseudomonadota bacterium]|nr:S1C family serine protease [Pseudomonadota bacterium]